MTIATTAFIFVFCRENPVLSGILAGFALSLMGVFLNILIFRKAMVLFSSPLLLFPFLLFKIVIAGIILFMVMTNGAYPHFIASGILLGIVYSSVVVIKSVNGGRCQYGSR